MRQHRGYFVSRKLLSKEWTANLIKYMAVDLPNLEAHLGKCPGTVGEEEVALFSCIQADAFRKGLKQVTQATHNDLRSMLELELKQATKKTDVDDDFVQHFTGHSKRVSLKHYQAKSLETISTIMQNLL